MKVKIVAWHDALASCHVRLLSRQCENCVGSCGLRAARRQDMVKELWVKNSVHKFTGGETAELVVSGKALILAAVIVFVIPVVLLIVSVAAGSFFELPERLLYAVAGLSLTIGLSASAVYGMQLDWSKLFSLQLIPVGNGSEP